MPAAQPGQDNLDRFGPTKEASAVSGYSERTLEGWRRRGVGFPYVRLNNGRCRYHLRTVVEYMLKRQRGEV